MKILLYADVHGNMLALDELQKTQDYKSADMRIFLGDAVGKCAFSNECLNKVFESGDVFLMGNHDFFCAFGLPESKSWTERKIEYVNFLREKVSDKNKEKLKKVKKDFCLERFGKKIYFTHYIWKCEGYVVGDPDDPDPPTEKTGKLFEKVQADYIFFAHNHQAADFDAFDKHFCCIGSLGVNKPGNYGEYVVLELTENRVKTERKCVFFDAEKMRKAILDEGSPRAEKYSKWFEVNNLSKSERLLVKSKNFLENFDLDFEHLKEELKEIKDIIFDCLAIKADVKISFDESKLFGKSGSFSGNNISFNKSRIETLFLLKIDDLDENNLTRLETFYANFSLKTTHSEQEQNLFDFMKKYKENGFERYFSSVGSYRTVKYELLDTVFHECEHVRQDVYLNFLTTQSFPKDVDSQVLLFVVLFNTMLEQLHKENVYVEYERGDNLTFPIEFDAIYASFEVLQALKITYFKADKTFGEYLKKRVIFPENFSPRETATLMFKDYETVYEAYSVVFGDKFSTLNTSIHDNKPIIIGEIAKRYDKMLATTRKPSY